MKKKTLNQNILKHYIELFKFLLHHLHEILLNITFIGIKKGKLISYNKIKQLYRIL
jgi:hypothetical protein